jgi:glycoprotein-N-acetylgalactosamine 3-beta-galactosyltransferase
MIQHKQHAFLFLFASIFFASIQFFSHLTLVEDHHATLYSSSRSIGSSSQDSSSTGTAAVEDETRRSRKPHHDNSNVPIHRIITTKVDTSPQRLIKSQYSLTRTPKCHPEGMMDELSYAVIQKIRRGLVVENQKIRKPLSLAGETNMKETETNRPKLLCMVYTYQGSHDTNLRAIVDTWATQCDGFWAASNVTDESLGAMKLEFPGPESYSNMWQKVKAMWKYVHEHYIDEFDYFHICGDDTYLIPDNFRRYFMSHQIEKLLNGHMDEFTKINKRVREWKNDVGPRPLLLGTPVHYINSGYHAFAAGGSGYTLNREAVKILNRLLVQDSLNMSSAVDSREDVIVSKYLEEVGITCSDTRDDSGAFRYVQDNPIRDYRDSDGDVRKKRKLNPKVHVHILDGLDAYSKETVALHLNYNIGVRWFSQHIRYTEEMIYRYHDLLSGKCDDILLSAEPNMTKIKHIAMTQQQYWFGDRNLATVLEMSLGFPYMFLSRRANCC